MPRRNRGRRHTARGHRSDGETGRRRLAGHRRRALGDRLGPRRCRARRVPGPRRRDRVVPHRRHRVGDPQVGAASPGRGQRQRHRPPHLRRPFRPPRSGHQHRALRRLDHPRRPRRPVQRLPGPGPGPALLPAARSGTPRRALGGLPRRPRPGRPSRHRPSRDRPSRPGHPGYRPAPGPGRGRLLGPPGGGGTGGGHREPVGAAGPARPAPGPGGHLPAWSSPADPVSERSFGGGSRNPGDYSLCCVRNGFVRYDRRLRRRGRGVRFRGVGGGLPLGRGGPAGVCPGAGTALPAWFLPPGSSGPGQQPVGPAIGPPRPVRHLGLQRPGERRVERPRRRFPDLRQRVHPQGRALVRRRGAAGGRLRALAHRPGPARPPLRRRGQDARPAALSLRRGAVQPDPQDHRHARRGRDPRVGLDAARAGGQLRQPGRRPHARGAATGATPQPPRPAPRDLPAVRRMRRRAATTGPRTPSTTPTSPGPRTTGPRSAPCRRSAAWSRSTAPAAGLRATASPT